MSVLIPLIFLYDIVKSVFLFAHVWLCRSGIMWRRYIPRLLDCFPHACSAMEQAHLIDLLNHPDLGHATKEDRDTPSAYPDSRSADETCPAYL